jgi:MFS family permease
MAFFMSFCSSSISNLTVYVTSSFQRHSLTALTGVISSLVAGIWKLPYAKIMNIWGRPKALSIGVTSYTLGLVMMAKCQNVQMYCAAMVSSLSPVMVHGSLSFLSRDVFEMQHFT